MGHDDDGEEEGNSMADAAASILKDRIRMTSDTVASESIRSFLSRFEDSERKTKSLSPHTFATEVPMVTRISSGSIDNSTLLMLKF